MKPRVTKRGAFFTKENTLKNFSVTRNGEELDPSLYTWDEKTKSFSTDENNLVLDFTNWHGVTFKTGNDCTFKTGNGCTFDTGGSCTFNTGSGCTFKTGSGCTFDTVYDCTFKTGINCTFNTGSGCTFKTGSGCTFDTVYDCTFKTGNNCTFKTSSNCTFKTGSRCTFDTGSICTFKTKEKCVVINRDTNEVIRLDNKENHYDMNEKQVKFENINVFKNGNDLNITLQLTQLESLRKILDKNTYFKLEKQIFEEMT